MNVSDELPRSRLHCHESRWTLYDVLLRAAQQDKLRVWGQALARSWEPRHERGLASHHPTSGPWQHVKLATPGERLRARSAGSAAICGQGRFS